MENSNELHPEIIPQAPEAATYATVGEPVTPKIPTPTPTAEPKKKLPLWIIVVGVILVIVIISLFFAAGQTSTSTVEPTPTPTATASATSSRVPSAIASQSAFIKFESDLDALTRGIQNTQIQNQQLLPPRLELPLGF